jgi:hypothetical protein
MGTTFLVATVLATALPNIALAQNTPHRQLSLPFHATGVVSLPESNVFLDGDKVVINPTGSELSDMIKSAMRFNYAFGQLSDAILGKFEVTGPHYTSAVPGHDYRKLEAHEAYRDASGDVLVARIVGKGVAPSPTSRAFTDSGTFMGGTGKFEAASGSFEGKATLDVNANTLTVEFTGTVNLQCGGKRQAEACTAAR